MTDTESQELKEKQEEKKGESTFDRVAPLIILFLIILVFTWASLDFILVNKAPASDDAVSHLSVAARVLYGIRGERPLGTLSRVPYPFGGYLITGLWMAVAGISRTSAEISLLFFSIPFIITVYLFGSHFGGRWGGIASAALWVSCPYFFESSVHYFLDMPGSFAGLLAFYLLLKSEKFKNTKYSILFGFALTFMLMVKWNGLFILLLPLVIMLGYRTFGGIRSFVFTLVSFLLFGSVVFFYVRLGNSFDIHSFNESSIKVYHYVLFILPGILLLSLSLLLKKKLGKTVAGGDGGVLFKNISDRDKENLPALLNGITALSIAEIITMPMYLFIIPAIFDHARVQTGRFTQLFSDTVRENFMVMTSSVPLLLFFVIIGIVFIIIKREKLFDFSLTLGALVSAFLISSALAPPSPRYLLIFIALLVITGGYWIGKIGKFKVPFAVLIVIFYSVSCCAYLMGPQSFLRELPQKNNIKVDEFFKLRPYNFIRPNTEEYHHGDVMKDIVEDFNSKRKKAPEDVLYLDMIVTRNFAEAGHRARSAQIRNDSMLFYSDFFIPSGTRFEIIHEQWEEIMMQHRDRTIYIFIAWYNKDFPNQLKNRIESSTNRRVLLISQYPWPGERKVGAVLLLPEGESGDDK